ncbi:unnamed protein product [Chondrus crispus]|uniref:Uncharacterized protein n=1 Tax=Chondrus crispus TaxID=2769 RepID=R7QJ37_CHOCR|nr:unnamed protein product [Chondrus crispus]CDF37430.1 unnamed protein product [Chondrus crispus]|eukprot:XP_005717249.1 unnamed protein product [Chondrus crispus]
MYHLRDYDAPQDRKRINSGKNCNVCVNGTLEMHCVMCEKVCVYCPHCSGYAEKSAGDSSRNGSKGKPRRKPSTRTSSTR